MLQLTAKQVIEIQNALNDDKRKEVIIRVENGNLVVILSTRKRIA